MTSRAPSAASAVAALALAVASPLEAVQSRDAPGRAFLPVALTGQVIDTYRGMPVAGAAVRVEGAERADGSALVDVTDASGRFAIADVPPGPNPVLVSRLGYVDLAQVLDVREGQFVEIAVIPKPVVLEGIEVYVDRLESRIRGLSAATLAFDEAALKTSPDLSVAQYLDSRPGLEFVPCFANGSSGGVFAQRRDCLRARGGMPIRPRIYVDDAPGFGGVRELASLPSREVYRVEVIRGCGQIRVYTIAYVEGAAAHPRPLPPIVC